MDLKVGDKVDLVIGVQTALGYSVLIDEEFEGLLFNSDVFTALDEGVKTTGYIKNIREDGKIDVSLRPQGFRNVIDTDVQKILDKLQKDGFLLLTDKSSPESIKFHLQMSKKAFKKAVGNLYRAKKIELKSDRIELVK
ncbi:DNA-binding protein [Flavobacteriaceae bacterium S356]|uniref:DNA-binding protein n=1 Tax=Asprobacillus argus TaxID=3076534 RepID=A0ABU3LHB2_9FLAO|nr:DNA-binding protein [Flavobacteriaceae bacterium S356]